MNSSAPFLSPSEAARRLGVSAKALRLYERRGLLVPVRTAAGWRAYGPGEMARAAEIAALRALGLSLAQVGRVLGGEPNDLEPALAAHQARLEAQARALAGTVEKVRSLRAGLAQGQVPTAGELAGLGPSAGLGIALDLPWPWGGERFELRDVRPLTYITGPLGSGKTRLAHRLAETLPGAAFVGLERLGGAALRPARGSPAIRRSGTGSTGRWPGSPTRAPRFRTPWSACWPNWNRRGPPPSWSTWWSRGSISPPRRP